MANDVVEILLVEDNPSDVELALHALKKNNLANHVEVVRDGAEALEFLFATGSYAGHAALLGGHLMLQSSRGASGSLPIADSPSEPEQPARSAVSAPYAAGALCAKNASPREVRSITVVLADRHDLIRQGMRSLLETEPSFTVVGEAADGWAALDLVNRLHPSVLVADFSLPGLSGTDVTRNVNKRFPQTRVLMLSSQAEEGYVLESLKSGAAGYALKQSGVEELIQAVREVAAGRRYLSPSLSERAIEVYVSVQQEQDYELGATSPLTSREREVLQLVTDGLTSAQIAEKLPIRPSWSATPFSIILSRLKRMVREAYFCLCQRLFANRCCPLADHF